MTKALGLIEVVGLTGAIEGADAALKAANVHLIDIAKVGSGIMTIQIIGDVGAVTAAVEAGADAAKQICHLRSSHVIPRIDESLYDIFENVMQKPENTENNTPPQEEIFLQPPSEEPQNIYTAEKLNQLSLSSLKDILTKANQTISRDDLKTVKKQELIQMILDQNLTKE